MIFCWKLKEAGQQFVNKVEKEPIGEVDDCFYTKCKAQTWQVASLGLGTVCKMAPARSPRPVAPVNSHTVLNVM